VTIEETVMAKMVEVFQVPREKVDLDSSPQSIANWDSLRHMKLVLTLESAIGREIPIDQVFEMLTVRKIVEVISSLTAEHGN